MRVGGARSLLAAAGICFAAAVAVVGSGVDVGAAPSLWEFTPEPMEQVPFGRTQIVGAELPEGGVRFILKNLTPEMPVQLTLVPSDATTDLSLEVYKDKWDAPLFTMTTGIEGEATLRLRTGDHVAMQVKGPAGASYQLLAWVGPEMESVPIPPLVTPETYTQRTGKPTAYGTAPTSPADADPAPQPETATDTNTAAVPLRAPLIAPSPVPAEDDSDDKMGLIVGLLAAILVALVVIAFLLMKKHGPPASAALLLAALLFVPGAATAQDDKTEPGKMKPEELNDRMNATLHKLRELTSGYSGNDPFNPDDKFTKGFTDVVKATGALLTLMEHFGFIDPREAAVRPDYNPSDAPPLPARGFEDIWNSDAQTCLRQGGVAQDLQKWPRLLENLRVIYKQTMLEAGRIVELADAAAGMSSIAKLKWTIDKNNPSEAFNQSQAQFYATYDDAYTKLMDKLNKSLVEIADCEKKVYGVDRWYELYGMPYYLYMRDRYKRP